MSPAAASELVDLRDKVVIVTGASRGIGRQIALAFAARGARVVVAARTVEPRRTLTGTIGETLGLINRAGGTAIGVECDVTKIEDLRKLVDAATEAFGQLDVLVNNAADMAGQDLEGLVEAMLGTGSPVAYGAFPDDGLIDNWLSQFATNVHAPFVLMALVAPHLRAQGGGVIINITSDSANMVPVERALSPSARDQVVRNRSLGYATTKAALNRLTNAAAAELASDNIAVVAVDPGVTRTELVELLSDRGILNSEYHLPMDVPAAAVVGIVTSGNPMAFNGQIVKARPE